MCTSLRYSRVYWHMIIDMDRFPPCSGHLSHDFMTPSVKHAPLQQLLREFVTSLQDSQFTTYTYSGGARFSQMCHILMMRYDRRGG